jgi:hypothetical protein
VGGIGLHGDRRHRARSRDAGSRADRPERRAAAGHRGRHVDGDLLPAVGGSFGVALFGAIFASRLASELSRLPADVIARLGDVGGIDPARAKQLPPEVHADFLQIFANALHGVFLVGMAIAIVPAVLAWLLKEVPLRTTLGRAAPPVEESLPEVPVETDVRAAAR